jgi:hypothetical protein
MRRDSSFRSGHPRRDPVPRTEGWHHKTNPRRVPPRSSRPFPPLAPCVRAVRRPASATRSHRPACAVRPRRAPTRRSLPPPAPAAPAPTTRSRRPAAADRPDARRCVIPPHRRAFPLYVLRAAVPFRRAFSPRATAFPPRATTFPPRVLRATIRSHRACAVPAQPFASYRRPRFSRLQRFVHVCVLIASPTVILTWFTAVVIV